MTAAAATVVVDSSALLAVVNNEPESGKVLDLLLAAEDLRMSAATWTEVFIVADRRDATIAGIMERLVAELEVRIEAVTESQARLARTAYRDYGRGRHTTDLNYGDCFAYALAKELGASLLFVGNAFGDTDIRPALD